MTIHLGIDWKHRAAKSEPIERLGMVLHCFRSHSLNSCSQSERFSVTSAR